VRTTTRQPRPPARPLTALLVALLSATAPLATPAAETPAGPAGAGPAQRMWWNQERMVASLELTDEQRTGLNERFLELLAERRTLARRYAGLRREMVDALVAGDWESAERKAGESGSTAGEINALDNRMLGDALRILQPAQRRLLAAEHPRLLNRPWLVGGMRGAGVQRGVRRSDG